MEKEILVEPLQKRFKVVLKDANRQKRNRSFPNASNCCGARLQQKKFCSVCGEEVDTAELTRKIVKIGKEEHLVEASALKQAITALEALDAIKLSTFMSSRPSGVEDYFDALVFVLPAKKREQQYAELANILKGKVAFGSGVFRNNEFQIMVEVGDDGRIRVRKLVEESQRYDIPTVDISVELNNELVELERKIVEKNVVDSFDLSKFRDARAEIEEQVIEDVVLNGGVVENVVPQVKQAVEEDEIERLKKLLND